VSQNHTRPGFLYNVSWEVCHHIGGVHTVLETAAPHLTASYGKQLLYVGPDLWSARGLQATFVEDKAAPPLAHLAAERGVPVRFGHCDMEGEPRVALVDFGRLLERKNAILGELWDDYDVDSIHADWDTIERMLFGYAAGILIELHYRVAVRPRGLRAVAQSMAKELGPQGIHVAHLLIDGIIDVPRVHESMPEMAAVKGEDGLIDPKHIAATMLWLHRQPRDAWTFELDLRPYGESW